MMDECDLMSCFAFFIAETNWSILICRHRFYKMQPTVIDDICCLDIVICLLFHAISKVQILLINYCHFVDINFKFLKMHVGIVFISVAGSYSIFINLWKVYMMVFNFYEGRWMEILLLSYEIIHLNVVLITSDRLLFITFTSYTCVICIFSIVIQSDCVPIVDNLAGLA